MPNVDKPELSEGTLDLECFDAGLGVQISDAKSGKNIAIIIPWGLALKVGQLVQIAAETHLSLEDAEGKPVVVQ